MLLRHATLARHLPSILARGLLCSKSQGKIKAVWLHSPAASTWAALHTIKRHGGRVEGVVIIEVNIPRRALRRSRKRLWYSTRDIPPACFRRAIVFQELAGASTDDGRRLATAVTR
jgi:hypothetical protein